MKKQAKKGLSTIAILGICFITIFPYIMMIICSFSTDAAIKGNTVFQNLSIENFMRNIATAINQKNFLKSILNSILVSVLSSVISIVISSIAGFVYGIYGKRDKLLNSTFLATIVTMYIPTVTIVIPIFLLLRQWGLLNSYIAIIILSTNIPFLVFLFKQNAELFPIELIKAAKLDGASEIKIFIKIFTPYFKHIYITAFLFSFFDAWNSVLLPVIVIQSSEKVTNSVFLNSISSIWNSDYAVVMVSLIISTLPSFLVFILFRNYMINGVSGTKLRT